MQLSVDQTYPHAQNLSRGLNVLRALNEIDGIGATPREISDRIGLNRTTVKRLLETLVREGYAGFCAADGSYLLAESVTSLSRGYTEEMRVLWAASPVIKSIARATQWSLRITCPNTHEMVVRDTTHANSALAVEFTVGVRHSIPMLLTAAGRAYFSSCGDPERARIVEAICIAGDDQSSLARNSRLITRMVGRVHEDGYAMNDGEWGGGRLGAVAVPIRAHSGKVLACLSMVFPRREASRSNIEQEFVPALLGGVHRISERLTPS